MWPWFWRRLRTPGETYFRQMGKSYRKPTLVLFTDQVDSGCGLAGRRSRAFLLSAR